MLNLLEFRSKARGLSDLLNYAAVIEDGVVLNKDGSLLAGWSFRGPDLGSSTSDELEAISARLNAALKFGSGWMVNCDAMRQAAPGYPESGAFPDRTTKIIDVERQQQFRAEGAHFESLYGITLTYMPPLRVEGKLANLMYERDGVAIADAVGERVLQQFKDAVNEFEAQLSTLFAVDRLVGRPYYDAAGRQHVQDRMLQYLNFCVTGVNHPVHLPPVPMYLDTMIGDDFFGGVRPRIGDRHIAVVALDGFPQESYPGILGALDELAIEYRWSTRFIFMDPFEARPLLDSMRRKWRGKMRGLKDQIFNTSQGAVDLDAAEMTADSEQAMAEAESGLVRFGYYTTVIVLTDTDRTRLDDSTREVRKLIQNLGFGARIETVNAVEAWLGSLPGHGHPNIRRPILHTLNLADMLPITAVWAGLAKNPCPFYPPDSPPLAHAATTGATPFRLNLHVGDVGHTLILGPTGAGKSTLLAFLIAQQFRYPRAQVFSFDKGYSLYCLNQAAGGEHYDIAGANSELAFCPLQQIDTAGDLAWAEEWIEVLCTMQGLQVSPRLRAEIHGAMELLRTSPTRTLTEFTANVQSIEVREALQHYTLSGPMGMLLDAERDSLGNGDFLTFELEHLMNLGEKNVVPVLWYLFRRIEKRLKGQPTLIPIDEAWMALSHPMFRDKIREWAKVLRKANAALLLATQSVSDVFNSPIRDVILESCPTKILLPNPEARNDAARRMYEVMGLNTRQVDILAMATPKQHYYYLSPLGRRLFQLGVGGVALSFIGASSKDDIAKVNQLAQQYGDSWPAEWLRSRGLADWAEYWKTI
jgi:type IV secretion system protein TrbE